METNVKPVVKKSFTDNMRLWFKGVTEPTARFLNNIGLTPNSMTIIGLIGNMIGAWFLSQGNMVMGGVFILICPPFDALDGTMARLRGEVTEFGAFVDSVSDRYSELFIIGGLLYHYSTHGNQLLTVLCYTAAAGSIMVSYVKARAESLKLNANTGLLTRMERYLVLTPLLLFNQPDLAIWILAIFTNVTALQRFFKVRQDAHKKASA